jgi:hypothetical protein
MARPSADGFDKFGAGLSTFSPPPARSRLVVVRESTSATRLLRVDVFDRDLGPLGVRPNK